MKTTIKQNKMNATISISNIITVITETLIFNIKASDFVAEISKYNEITVKGWISMKKFDKYTDMLKENGFSVSETIFSDIKKDLSIDFYIKFKK
jgi:hypothetical protein